MEHNLCCFNNIPSKIKKYLLILYFLFSIPSSVHAIATCTGEICDILPPQYLQQINELELQFRLQYLDKLVDSMGRASTMGNVGTGMIGLGSLNKFQIGVGGSASFLTNKAIEIAYKETYLRRLPNLGFSIAPSVSFGVNLGWLLHKDGGHEVFLKDWEELEEDEIDSEKDTFPHVLHRFNLYMHGMKINAELSDFQSIQPKNFGASGSLEIENYGAMLRYVLITPGLDHDFYRFMGMNVGIGYYRFVNNLNVISSKHGNTEFKSGPFIGAWIGNTNLDYKLTTSSIPIDLRVGLEFLKVFTLFFGGGYSKNDVDVSLLLTRSGPLRLSMNPNFPYLTNVLTPALFQTIQEITKREGYLDLRTQSESKLSYTQGFGVIGLEFHLGPAMLFAEANIYRKSGAGVLGIKLSF